MDAQKATEVKITSHSNRSYIVTTFSYISAETWLCIPDCNAAETAHHYADGMDVLNRSTFNTKLPAPRYKNEHCNKDPVVFNDICDVILLAIN
jgi:hypothetical protein